MTEISIDAYFSKLDQLETACLSVDTTKTELETLINDLDTLNGTLETELTTIPFPVTVFHLQKLILIETVRANKLDLHASLAQLKKCRKENIDSYAGANTYVDLVAYTSENKAIEDYIDNTVIPNCTCMTGLKKIIKDIGGIH